MAQIYDDSTKIDIENLPKGIGKDEEVDLINLGIILDIIVRDICFKLKDEDKPGLTYENGSGLVVKSRAWSSDFDLDIKEVGDIGLPNKKNMTIQVDLKERFKFASAEFIHEYLEKRDIITNIDDLTSLFTDFRKESFIYELEDYLLKKYEQKGIKEIRKQDNYYQILEGSFNQFKQKKKNYETFIKEFSGKYKQFNNFEKSNLVKILDTTLQYYAEKKIIARAIQDAIDNDWKNYYAFFEELYEYATTKKVNAKDTKEKTELKAKICAAAFFYKKNIYNGNFENIIINNSNIRKKDIIEFDDFGATSVIEVIQQEYANRHGLVSGVGKTLKVTDFDKIREGFTELEREKIFSHRKGSFHIKKKFDEDNIYKTGQAVFNRYLSKLIERRVFTCGENLVQYYIKETNKTIPRDLENKEVSMKKGQGYTAGLLRDRRKYFRNLYINLHKVPIYITLERKK